jgi:DNA (cytosine-5)-methyltransferase 1
VKSYFSEIDKHAVAVYKQQFKDAEYVGSVTDVRGAELPRIDLITFGSPCQDFSLAGKRKGLSGDRSSLVLESIRLINECRPSVFIWENVKGTFSSNAGADFWAIIQAFTNIGGYRLEWQLLNTSWVLPQNRERVYLVGYSTTPGGDWSGVFPIGEGSRENTKLSGQQGNTCTLTARYGTGTNGSYVTERKQYAQEVKVTDKRGNEREATKASTLVAGYYKLPSDADYIKVKSATSKGYEEATDIRGNEQIATIRSGGRGSLTAKHSWDIVKVKSANKQGYEVATEGDSINLSQPNSETRRGRVGKGKAQTLETSCNQAAVQDYRIRRLTPIECERLQGFPDNHTEYGNYDGEVKKMSNTQRYKQCSNAVTVDIVALVAEAVKPLFK